jgi:Fe2+ transport system protein FeoA
MIGHHFRHHRHPIDYPPPAGSITLDQIPLGAEGDILAINGDRRMRRRMMEMGLLEGAHLRITKFGPTGDPIQVRVNDYYLSLRLADAANIVVKPSQYCTQLRHHRHKR